jgi:hypothetical protein
MTMRDPFDGMEHQDCSGTKLPKVGGGTHLLKIARCLTPRAGGVAFIVEFEVVQSNDPGHVVGSQRSVYLRSNFTDSFQKMVKACLGAACGYDMKDPTQHEAFSPFSAQVARAAIGEANPLEGRLIGCDGIPGKKLDPKTGLPYCDYLWSVADSPLGLPLPGAQPTQAYRAPQYTPPQVQYQAPAPPPVASDAPPGWKRLPGGQFVKA